MMQISSMPLSMASSPMIWMTGLVRPSRSTIGNISFCTAVDAGYWRGPPPAAGVEGFRRFFSLLLGGLKGDGKERLRSPKSAPVGEGPQKHCFFVVGGGPGGHPATELAAGP